MCDWGRSGFDLVLECVRQGEVRLWFNNDMCAIGGGLVISSTGVCAIEGGQVMV